MNKESILRMAGGAIEEKDNILMFLGTGLSEEIGSGRVVIMA